jgi:hypothetical protein
MMILQEFNKHYKNLLKTRHVSTSQPNLTALYQPHPSEPPTPYMEGSDLLRLLTEPITLNELKHAMFTLPKDKASSPDKYPIEFFQTY